MKRPGLQSFFYRTLRASLWLCAQPGRPAQNLHSRLLRWKPLATPAQLRKLCGTMKFGKVAPHQLWAWIDFLLYESPTLGRRHTRYRLPPPAPCCAACGQGRDGWMHIWGLSRDEETGEGSLDGDGCPVVKAWAFSKGLWDDPALWRTQMFRLGDEGQAKKLAKFVATITRMYRWARYGGMPGNGDGSSTHFRFDGSGFNWAWDVEGSTALPRPAESRRNQTAANRRRRGVGARASGSASASHEP